MHLHETDCTTLLLKIFHCWHSAVELDTMIALWEFWANPEAIQQ